MQSLVRVLSFAPLALLATSASAQGGEGAGATCWNDFEQAVTAGKWWLKLRLRYENVDQDGFSHEASASTLRTVLGYETGAWHGASVLLEFEDVSALGHERFNSTTNGETNYPVVADPESSEVNQAFLRYAGIEGLQARVGRQVITHDRHRFVGDVGWRQNQQTFDAGVLEWTGLEHLSLSGAFVENVNRVFGEDSPQGDHRMSSYLLRASYGFPEWGEVAGYAYLLDYDSLDTLSSNTVGLRFAGRHAFDPFAVSCTVEGALQGDAGDNPNEVDQDYRFVELGGEFHDTGLLVGHETLGGSGKPGDAFQTPLATLHAFNGWADEFLTTPDTGLVDVYLGATQKLGSVDVRVVWHSFEADSGSGDYGSELDASLTWTPTRGVQLGLKVADYQAEDFATDTTKAWVWLAYAP